MNIPKGTANGQVVTWNAAKQAWEPVAPSAGAPAGADRQVQFNDAGSFGADSDFSFLAPTAGERYLSLDAPTATGTAGYRVRDNAGTWQGELVYDDNANQVLLRATTTAPLIIETTQATLTIRSVGPGAAPLSIDSESTLLLTGDSGLFLNGGESIQWPTADGNANELIFTDGAGALDFVSPAGVDTTAIHDDTAGEINAITSKATPVGADIILIEDSAAGFAKKKATISSLPGSGGGGPRTVPYYGPRVRNQFNSTNTIYLVRIIASHTMTLTNMSFFVSSTSGTDNWLFGIYNAALTSLLREGSFTPSTAGWVTNALSSGIAIAEGTQYWIAWKGTNGGANIGGATDNFTNANNTRSLFNSGSSLPANASGATAASNIFNFYLNGDE